MSDSSGRQQLPDLNKLMRDARYAATPKSAVGVPLGTAAYMANAPRYPGGEIDPSIATQYRPGYFDPRSSTSALRLTARDLDNFWRFVSSAAEDIRQYSSDNISATRTRIPYECWVWTGTYKINTPQFSWRCMVQAPEDLDITNDDAVQDYMHTTQMFATSASAMKIAYCLWIGEPAVGERIAATFCNNGSCCRPDHLGVMGDKRLGNRGPRRRRAAPQ